MQTRRDSASRPWHLYVLAVVAVAVAVLAIVEIGPPTSSARTSKEIVTAENGVVQSTVTGSGNIAAGTDLDVNFKAAGTLQTLDVSQGQHVNQGQLLATLDPTSAQLALDQADESLNAAEYQLTAAENGTSSASAAAGSGTTNASLTGATSGPEYVSDTHDVGASASSARPDHHSSTPTTTITTITTITTEPATNKPTGHSGGTGSSSGSSSGSSGSRGSGSSTHGSGSTGTTTTSTPSPASIASAQAAVYGAEANVQSAEQALANTKLYAPTSGTIVSLASLLPGDSVSAGSTSDASSASSSSSSSSSSGGFTGGSTTAGSLGGSSSSSSSSSSSPFAEIVNTDSLTMTVAFSESDITKVKVGQPATVTLDALPGVELGSHVSQISTVGTTSSGVVSYDATLTLDQTDSQIKPGMSASASVIVSQAQGVTVPNEAVTGTGSLGTVNLMRHGKTVSQQVVVGLRGDSRTQIISGLSAGQQVVVTVVLPSLSTPSTSTTSSTGTLGGTGLGGGAARALGGGGFFGGGGGGAFFRGGGG